ncbi:unnamed protein product, partial [Mesorhabditis belari]|uniref:Glutaminyl-peptide cyclotransferase n=1 Tax=Mesorhabditis belari TaxID=2138241 RepID=A0AAF3J487_9BILA
MRVLLQTTMRNLTVLTIFLLTTSIAWGQWRTNQRSHTLSVLPKNSTYRLCSDFWDLSRFKSFLKPILVPRIVGTPQHRQVGDFLQKTMQDMGWHTEWDEFTDNTPYGVKPFRSLIATYNPQAARRLVLACHYDSKILPGQTFLAATDSAVPCAMMLDVAKTLTPYMYRQVAQDVSLQLLFLDGEEAFVEWTATDSIYGARHLASKLENKWYPTSSSASNFELSREIDRIDVFMLLDLLGAPNPRIQNANGLGATQLFAELPNIESEIRQMNCVSQRIPQVFSGNVVYQAVEDDHIPFRNRGVPILHLIAAPFPSVWHQPTDNENAIHYPTIKLLTSVVRIFAAKYLGIAPL